MEVYNQKESVNVLAIAGLALSIFAFVLALIPCVGAIAFLPALLGLLFAIIGLAQSDRYRTSRSLAIIGIILGATALAIAGAWSGIISSYTKNGNALLDEKIEHHIEKLKEKLNEAEVRIELKKEILSEAEKEQISREAEKAGEIAEKIATEIWKGIRSIRIETEEDRIIVTIPKGSMTEAEKAEFEKELKELEDELRKTVNEFKITIKERSDSAVQAD